MTCVVIAAASSRMVAAKPVLKWPQPPMAPVSSTHSREKSPLCARSFAGGLHQQLAAGIGAQRRPGREGLRGRIAGRARIIGRSRGRSVLTTSPVIGLLRSKVAPLFAATSAATDLQFDFIHGFVSRSPVAELARLEEARA